jgi:uncharacterized membrane protein
MRDVSKVVGALIAIVVGTRLIAKHVLLIIERLLRVYYLFLINHSVILNNINYKDQMMSSAWDPAQ